MDPTGGIVSYVVNKIGDLLSNEIALLGNTQQDLQWVQSELRFMQPFLKSVAEENIQDPYVNIWLQELRRLAIHAEDAVNTLYLHLGNPTRKSFLSCCIPPIKSRHDFGTQIKKLRRDLEELPRRKKTYVIKIPDKGSTTGTVDQMDNLELIRWLRGTCVEDGDLVGFDDHVKAVTDLLVPKGGMRSVVSIVGMGGVGKTTLAKKVYNNLLKSSWFDCTAWVDVSRKYDILGLLKKIAEGIMKLSSEVVGRMDRDTLVQRLREFIRSKKYLIVLDDVWTSKLGVLWESLPDPKNGSRIIITTRKKEVARSANPSLSPYELTPLGEKDSRVLFTKKVFPDAEDPEQCCTEELANLRERILKQCSGLPLAIVAVGGLLCGKEKTPAEWREVAEKIDWYQTERGDGCMGILALSYVDLPIHLKWCFLYLASIPEDCKVFARRLLRLWIAEGFVELEQKKTKSLEETAERYLEELVQRCLIQVVERNPYGSVELCRVHDLFLALAVSEAEKQKFLNVWSSPFDENPGALFRRLSFTTDGIQGTTQLPLGSNKLRTLLVMDRRDWERGEDTYLVVENIAGVIEWSSIHRNLKLLRVLELGVYIHHLPDEIEHMVNLRYLSLSSYALNELPQSLGNLLHLQTLDVGTTHVNCLPVSIWRIRTLRYLRGGWETRLPEPDPVLPPNTCFQDLRTLRHVLAHPWMESILPNLKNLKELEICRDRDGSIPDYLCITIKSLQSLNVLILAERKFSYGGRSIMELGKIFSPSTSHTSLHTLELSDLVVESSQIVELPRNINQVKLAYATINHGIIELLGKLLSLYVLRLNEVSIVEKKMTFESGWFPRLDVLSIDDLDIESWELVTPTLPVLRDLEIRRCSPLQVLPEGLKHISTLKSLTLRDISSQLQEKLNGEDLYKVQHIERVRIYP